MSKKRTSISLSVDAIEQAAARYKALGYESFSEYLEFLIMQDAKERRQHVTVRDDDGVRYESKELLQHEEDDKESP